MIQIRNWVTNCIAFGALALLAAVHGTAARATTETVIYSFCGQELCSDGAYPYTGPIGVKGKLYGTTYAGGDANGFGTVYAVDPGIGSETVLHAFVGGTDGALPLAGLIDAGGTLYGVTGNGGNGGNCYLGCGTVFAVALKTGAEKVLHAFGGGADGASPVAGMIDVAGMLYGTTLSGGASGEGTVFSLDPKTRSESVLHSFGNGTDGASPYAGLIDVKGTLYGTTSIGGTYGGGTVFAIDLKAGTESVLYSFGGGADGASPVASLIDEKGTLYGTTALGGKFDGGTVFSLDPKTGAESVLHAFDLDDSGGAEPESALVDMSGTLYGTAYEGGTASSGVLFSLDPKTGKETVLYSFCTAPDCTDGQNPIAGLSNINGTLYSTTWGGGHGLNGVLFAITP